MTQSSSPEDGLQECGKWGPLHLPKPSADGSRRWLLEKNKPLSVHLPRSVFTWMPLCQPRSLPHQSSFRLPMPQSLCPLSH